MAELDNGMDKKLIADANAPQKSFNPQYVTDDRINGRSAKEVYFRWLSRLVMVCAVLSLGAFLCASLVIFRLAPEIIVEPLLITSQNDSETMVRYEPITPKMPSIKKMTELFVKQYVIMRNTVINDEDEMRTRWGPGGIVAYLSTPQVYREFVGKNIKDVGRMFEKGYSKEVRIDSVGQVSESSPAWIVNFTIYNLSQKNETNGLTLKKTKMRASLTPRFIPERGAVYARLINPLGFTVIKYNQDEIRE
ncbi:MAG: type IV secretion system protein [Pseudomonadota bacterium]|nr:type IV secretion system protein [Pseudomonadota bacterium]